jgi:hypothetical protein
MPINGSGILAAKICIDAKGKVLYAKTIPEKTTIQKKSIRMDILRALLGYEYDPSPNGVSCECGLFTFRLDFSRLNR